jgi:hypothetical protein
MAPSAADVAEARAAITRRGPGTAYYSAFMRLGERAILLAEAVASGGTDETARHVRRIRALATALDAVVAECAELEPDDEEDGV